MVSSLKTVLQNTVELDMATIDEKVQLLTWKKYRIQRNHIDTAAAPRNERLEELTGRVKSRYIYSGVIFNHVAIDDRYWFILNFLPKFINGISMNLYERLDRKVVRINPMVM